jgi:hypothetical protein
MTPSVAREDGREGLDRHRGRRVHPSDRRRRTLGMMGRRSLRILRGSLLAVALAAVPGAVLAHPIGNFTINHYAGITISPTGISLDVVIDMAEIPAFQERLRIDEDGDGEVSDEESTQAAATECVTLASTIRLTVDGAVLVPAPGQAGLSFPSGAGGLSTMRLECRLEADVALQPARDDDRLRGPVLPRQDRMARDRRVR